MRNFRAKTQPNDRIKAKCAWKRLFDLTAEIPIFNIEINTESNSNSNEFQREFNFFYLPLTHILVFTLECIIPTLILK